MSNPFSLPATPNPWAKRLATPAPNESATLLRGGETLALHKAQDRFTVSVNDRPRDRREPMSSALGPPIAEVGGTVSQIMPLLSLAEVQVPAERLDAVMAKTRQQEQVAFASHVYQPDAGAQDFYLTDQITIQFTPDTPLSDVDAIAAAAGLRRLEAIEGVANAYSFQVTAAATVNPLKLANRIALLPPVRLVEPNVAVLTESFHRPRDPLYQNQWYLQHQGGGGLTAGSHIAVEAAWDITRGRRSVVVAVIDDGFDLNHPDFAGPGKIVAPRDLRQRDGVPLPEQSGENHGTAVAGLAVAEENGQGIVGVAPGCALMPMRYSGIIDDQSIETMFAWAVDQGASIISCSWGPVGTRYTLSLRQRAAITRAATQGRNGKGAVILFAAGNANRPVDGTINEQGWPGGALRGRTQWLNGFAVHPDVITVSACTSLNRKAAYSNWGQAIAVTAPSNNAPPGLLLPSQGFVNSAPPIQQALPGRGVLTSDRLGAAGYASGDVVSAFGGTSSACPIVAGVVALMLSANPDLTPPQVRQILQRTADKIIDSQADPQLGLRRGMYDVQGHSEWFGYGKVNAERAVRAAQQQMAAPVAATRWLTLEDNQSVPIPDNSEAGLRRRLTVSNTGNLRGIGITLRLQHPFLGDVEVDLIAPSGEVVRLQSRLLGRLQSLETTYSTQTTPLLNRLLNQPVRGLWQLQVRDCGAADVGELLGWQLQLGL